MESIDKIRASDGSGNASVATVQSTRSPMATTIVVDTVAGINATFTGSMGTPHTFTDPITSETITVISDATCVDFEGHVDGSNLEIDTIAPGYTDLGSAVGDIVIIRPTTQWSNNVADVLDVAHNDDGTLKDDAVTADVIADGAVTPEKLVAGAGTDWAWQTWTPTWTNLTAGNAVLNYAKYVRTGKTVRARLGITLGNSSSVSGVITVSLPVTSASSYVTGLSPLGEAVIFDAGTAIYVGRLVWVTTTTAKLTYYVASTSNLTQADSSGTAPMTWTTSDGLYFDIEYEGA